MKCTIASPIKMSDFRRWYVPGGTTFFTLVTYNRSPIFTGESARALLGEVMRNVKQEHDFTTVAIVLLHDHLHAIWKLPRGDDDFSTRWKKIKRDSTVQFLAAGGSEANVTRSQLERGNRGIWQRRFWEHQIDDADELSAYCDYIHYNPVKHGYVERPWDWPYSSFRRFVKAGSYERGWGRSAPDSIVDIDAE